MITTPDYFPRTPVLHEQYRTTTNYVCFPDYKFFLKSHDGKESTNHKSTL